MTTPLSDDLLRDPADDVLELLDTCRRADLEREGIAMYVAVADLRAGRPPSPEPDADPAADPAAERLAELFDHYHDALERAGFPRPTGEPVDAPDPTAGGRRLIDVLVVLSDRHLHADVQP